MAKYLANVCGKGNQSFVLRSEENERLFEANLVKFKLLGASDYEFVNKKTNSTTEHKIGKTVSTEQGFGNWRFGTSSFFKIDGTNCFKILEDKGYYFKMVRKLKLIHPEFELLDVKTDEPVAHLTLNVLSERQPDVFGIGNKQSNTEIESDLEDLEVLFLAAFILSRVDLSANVI